ncbi:putative sulfate exporter family transporter [Pseudoalteromonas rubra]|uniref:Putative sulfate exporter family transporter n=1 Tax=Pseudoalteromonas rubra TaxID=43658 RepID=A0A5S3UWK6_9GAMM|nr:MULTISPECIES: putative sulfate exporter family transporter [Pseudoalteromonas]MEC4089251.1 putative sulfate exporter family transporter [Pseudoalteromonas rubra]QPB83258.1 putative sulfate exporter family transporter [Pseudoalteromonas rubra]
MLLERPGFHKALFLLAFLFALSPFASASSALFIGLGFALVLGNPLPDLSNNASKWLLKLAVIGLGFNVNIEEVLAVGRSSLVLTIVSITATIGLGEILTQVFRLNRNTGTLISFGTAICGGSAIAAMAPVIKARQDEIAISLSVIFALNALGLLVFPWLGHYFSLSESQFALWSALAIHDTSSVVAAASVYGPVALTMATTIKLTRAMWIVPYAAMAGVFWRSSEKASIPLFIIGFVAAAMINTWLPDYQPVWSVLYSGAKSVLVASLFLIGSGVSMAMLRQSGWRPFAMASVLWFIVSGVMLLLILDGLVTL